MSESLLREWVMLMVTVRGIFGRLNDPSSVTHGVVSTGLVAGLALIEPRKLTTGRRLVYRVGVAAVGAWTMWVSLRPNRSTELDLLGPVGRAAITAGAAGAILGLAEAGEVVDARLHDGLVRAGARRPRRWLALGEAALSLVAWWTGRLSDRAETNRMDGLEEPIHVLVEMPADWHAVALFLLSATDEHGAPELREQLSAARLIAFDDGGIEVSFARFDTPGGLPRAVPGNAMFPVVGRFRALDDRTFDVRIYVEDGRLENIQFNEAADWTEEELEEWHAAGHSVSQLTAWPSPEEVELLVETSAGLRPAPRGRQP